MTSTKKPDRVFKPTIRSIGFTLAGALFSTSLAKLAHQRFVLPHDSSLSAAGIIAWIIIGIFIILLIACLVLLIAHTKYVTLNDHSLTLSQPFLFTSTKVPLNSIERIVESDFHINPSHRGSVMWIYSGHQITIHLQDRRKFKVGSFETSDYYSFTKELSRVLSLGTPLRFKPRSGTRNKYEGYGWLLFIIIISLCLSFAVFLT